jgi:hypothetical protein
MTTTSDRTGCDDEFAGCRFDAGRHRLVDGFRFRLNGFRLVRFDGRCTADGRKRRSAVADPLVVS